ncbi:unnamed protein product [Cunninghamella blakesleeana]
MILIPFSSLLALVHYDDDDYHTNIFIEQYIVRLVLGSCVYIGILKFGNSLTTLYGSKTTELFFLLNACQFHLIFWSSRTLPNMFALPLVLFGLSHWIQRRTALGTHQPYHLKWMIYYFSIAGIIFRFECGILLVILLIYELCLHHHLPSLFSFLKNNIISPLIISCVSNLILTLLIDSWFWQPLLMSSSITLPFTTIKLLWPEGMVFYFNAILNKSSEWGTLPFYAYFILFLPRLLMISYPLAILGFILHPIHRKILFPFLIYILLFSLLPHKEWRFIVYTLPTFTAVASKTLSDLLLFTSSSYSKKKEKKEEQKIISSSSSSVQQQQDLFKKNQLKRIILRLFIISGLITSFLLSALLLWISTYNYPGGVALYDLHEQLKNETGKMYIHLDVKTAMTGASRFGQKRDSPHQQWEYSKNETHQRLDDYFEQRYTHLITSSLTPFFINEKEKRLSDELTLIKVTHGLERVQLRKSMIKDLLHSLISGQFFSWQHFRSIIQFPLEIKVEPSLYLLKVNHPQRSWVEFTLRNYSIIIYCDTLSSECHHANQKLKQVKNKKKDEFNDQVIILDEWIQDQQEREKIQHILNEKSNTKHYPKVFIHGEFIKEE